MSDPHRGPRRKLPFGAALGAGFALGLVAGLGGLQLRSALRIPESYRQRLAYNQVRWKLWARPEPAPGILAAPRPRREMPSRSLFWVTQLRTGRHYYADLKASGELFASAFPGYPDSLRRDDALWDAYLRRDPRFNAVGFAEAISRQVGEGYALEHSWLGCLDLYRRAGADVIVVGSSETLRSVVPDLLGARLGRPDLRILMCGAQHLPPRAAIELFKALRGIRRERGYGAPAVVWGYSLWHAYDRSPNVRAAEAGLIASLRSHPARSGSLEPWDGERAALGPWSDRLDEATLALRRLFPPIAWEDLVFFDRRLERDEETRGPAEEGLEAPLEELRAWSERGEPAFAAWLGSRIAPKFRALEGVAASDCSSPEPVRLLAEARAALRELARRAYVFVPPITRLATARAPGCFAPFAHRILREAATAELRARPVPLDATDDPAGPIRLLDFVQPSARPDYAYFNVNHLGNEGARKATRALARWLRAEGLGAEP